MKKENIKHEKTREYKTSIGIQVTIILENKLQKEIFYQNMTIFLPTDASILDPCLDRNVHTHITG